MSFWKKRPTSCLQSQLMSLAEGIAFAVTYESMLLCDPNLPVYTHGGQRFDADLSARKDTIRDTTSRSKRGVAYKVVGA